MKYLLLLVLLIAGCVPAPKPEPTPVMPEPAKIPQLRQQLARDIVVAMYSQREGLRGHDPDEAIREAREVAAKFYE